MMNEFDAINQTVNPNINNAFVHYICTPNYQPTSLPNIPKNITDNVITKNGYLLSKNSSTSKLNANSLTCSSIILSGQEPRKRGRGRGRARGSRAALSSAKSNQQNTLSKSQNLIDNKFELSEINNTSNILIKSDDKNILSIQTQSIKSKSRKRTQNMDMYNLKIISEECKNSLSPVADKFRLVEYLEDISDDKSTYANDQSTNNNNQLDENVNLNYSVNDEGLDLYEPDSGNDFIIYPLDQNPLVVSLKENCFFNKEIIISSFTSRSELFEINLDHNYSRHFSNIHQVQYSDVADVDLMEAGSETVYIRLCENCSGLIEGDYCNACSFESSQSLQSAFSLPQNSNFNVLYSSYPITINSNLQEVQPAYLISESPVACQNEIEMTNITNDYMKHNGSFKFSDNVSYTIPNLLETQKFDLNLLNLFNNKSSGPVSLLNKAAINESDLLNVNSSYQFATKNDQNFFDRKAQIPTDNIMVSSNVSVPLTIDGNKEIFGENEDINNMKLLTQSSFNKNDSLFILNESTNQLKLVQPSNLLSLLQVHPNLSTQFTQISDLKECTSQNFQLNSYVPTDSDCLQKQDIVHILSSDDEEEKASNRLLKHQNMMKPNLLENININSSQMNFGVDTDYIDITALQQLKNNQHESECINLHAEKTQLLNIRESFSISDSASITKGNDHVIPQNDQAQKIIIDKINGNIEIPLQQDIMLQKNLQPYLNINERLYTSPTTLHSNEEHNVNLDKQSMDALGSDSGLNLNNQQPTFQEDNNYFTTNRDVVETMEVLFVERLRQIRFGSYPVSVDTDAFFSKTSLSFQVPIASIQTQFVLPFKEFKKIYVHHGPQGPVLFILLKALLLKLIKEKINDQMNRLDLSGTDEGCKFIILIPRRQSSHLTKEYLYPYFQEIQKESINNLFEILGPDVTRTYLTASQKAFSQSTNQNLSQTTNQQKKVEELNDANSVLYQIPLNGPSINLFSYPSAQQKGSFNITNGDFFCLRYGQLINDVIIDFYLMYIVNEIISPDDRDRSHLFSSFFYSCLNSKQTNTNIPISELRHQKVRRWTKNIDLFSKDFIIIPINENMHWYLAIICYCGIRLPVIEHTTSNEHGENEATITIKKRACILIFDSLIQQAYSNTPSILRDYISEEWKAKKEATEGAREFNETNMPHYFPRCPIQTNIFDCGLYLLQNAEAFFNTPIRDLSFPMPSYLNWFSRQLVDNKRQQIIDLIITLKDQLNPNLHYNPLCDKLNPMQINIPQAIPQISFLNQQTTLTTNISCVTTILSSINQAGTASQQFSNCFSIPLMQNVLSLNQMSIFGNQESVIKPQNEDRALSVIKSSSQLENHDCAMLSSQDLFLSQPLISSQVNQVISIYSQSTGSISSISDELNFPLKSVNETLKNNRENEKNNVVASNFIDINQPIFSSSQISFESLPKMINQEMHITDESINDSSSNTPESKAFEINTNTIQESQANFIFANTQPLENLFATTPLGDQNDVASDDFIINKGRFNTNKDETVFQTDIALNYDDFRTSQ